MTPETDLELSIKCLSAYNIEPAIIKNMLDNLEKIKSSKQTEMIVKEKEQEQNYFGITAKETHEILTKQNFECAVCGMPLLTYAIVDDKAVCDNDICNKK